MLRGMRTSRNTSTVLELATMEAACGRKRRGGGEGEKGRGEVKGRGGERRGR